MKGNSMATRSTIAIQNQDGTVTGIYCHWDGYLEHNGRILHDHYTTEEIVRELISFGHMSSLGIGIHPDPNEDHDFEEPQKNVCVFYGRDRGEREQEAETFHNWNNLLNSQGQAYNYLFVPGEGWYVRSFSISGRISLADVFQEESV
jgi:hypothetical protein